MVDILYSIIDFVCILILCILGLQNKTNSIIKEKQRSFTILIFLSILFCIFDGYWGLVASHSILDFSYLDFATTLFYLGAGFMAMECFIFMIRYVGLFENIENKVFVYIVLQIPFYIYSFLLILNINQHLIFSVVDGEYYRGHSGLIILFYMLHWFYYLASFIVALSVALSKKNEATVRISVLSFALIPIIFGFFQLYNPNQPHYAIGFMFSCFIIFIFDVIAEREIVADKILEAKQKHVLNQCNEALSGNSPAEKNINKFLSLLSEYYDSDRVYVVLYDDERKELTCEYEKTESIIQFKNTEVKEFSSKLVLACMNNSSNNEKYFSNVFSEANLTEELQHELKKFGIMSAIFSQLTSGGIVFGYIGFDNPRNSINDFSMLRTISIYINSEILRKKQVEKEQKQNNAVLLALAAEYSSVYYINLNDDSLVPYRYDSLMKKRFAMTENMVYRDSIKKYIEDVVLEDDREDLLQCASLENLRRKLKNRASIRKQYRSTINGRIEYYQAKWVKVEEKNGIPIAVVLGLANIDEAIRNRELISEQQKQLETAIEQAESATKNSQIDKLTGLYNKHTGEQLLAKYIENKLPNEKYAVIFIDIDKFKDFNDNYGHLVGDEILNCVGSVIKSSCRKNDIPIRFGGDEFLIILKNVINSISAVQKAEGIRRQLKEMSKGHTYDLTCSIGIYVSNNDDVENSIEKADKALYFVKENGRNNVKIQE